MNNEHGPVELLINVDVEDRDTAIGFYQRGLGLRLTRRPLGGTVPEMDDGTSFRRFSGFRFFFW